MQQFLPTFIIKGACFSLFLIIVNFFKNYFGSWLRNFLTIFFLMKLFVSEPFLSIKIIRSQYAWSFKQQKRQKHEKECEHRLSLDTE